MEKSETGIEDKTLINSFVLTISASLSIASRAIAVADECPVISARLTDVV